MKNQYLLTLFFLLSTSLSAFAHKLQVEPVVAAIRPQSTFVTIEFAGNGEDVIQAVGVSEKESTYNSIARGVWPRFEKYVNSKFKVRQGGRTLQGKILRLDYERPDPLDFQTSKFHAIFRYERPAALSNEPFEVKNALFDYLPNAQTTLSVRGIQKNVGTGKTVTFDPSQVTANLLNNIKDFAILGVEHIFTGPDHVLFIVALLLTSTSFLPLTKTLTGFTIAHSVTLVGSALSIFVLPTQWVEILIALSIVWVGLENIFFPNAERYRFFLAAAFGLVHGFGFSYILREIGLPEEGLGWCLLSFNLGVEVAQILICAIAWPLLIAARKKFEHNAQYGGMNWTKAVTIGSWAVVAVGGYWLAERVFSA